MISTHSPTKDKKMVVSKEISNYFTKLLEPLVITERLQEMFGKLKEEIIERFEELNLSLSSSSHGDTGKMFTRIDQGDLKMAKRNRVKVLLAFHWIRQSEGIIF